MERVVEAFAASCRSGVQIFSQGVAVSFGCLSYRFPSLAVERQRDAAWRTARKIVGVRERVTREAS